MVELRRLATGVLAMALHVAGSHISWRKCQLSFELAGGSALLLWSGAMPLLRPFITSFARTVSHSLLTAEVTMLLGARPGTERVERGGLVARRVSRNVWNLSRLNNPGRSDNERYDGFRRRL